jgi:hypothetical protein
MMELRKTGGSAFPVADDASDMPGMTLRDYFAGNVLQGFCAAPVFDWDSKELLAKSCYEMADAMLEARKA